MGAFMLFESHVVDHVCAYLEKEGCKIEGRCHERQKGPDIDAIDGSGVRIYIEAKGQTSSNMRSKRFGKPFNTAQVKDHVANALYTAFAAKQKHPDARIGMAFPNVICHKKYVEPISLILKAQGIEVYWVTEEGGVVLDR